MNFSNNLIQWYLQNKRELPWRNTTEPYKIWLSEIILQQTKVAQGTPYFLRFTEAFPTVFDLADASEKDILKLWQGLGYYTRARNLHLTAKYIVSNLNGVFPDNYKELIKLKGIGEYTAAAISSFSYNENVPVVDGNVFRVLSRYFNVESDISKTSSKKIFTELAKELLPENNASTFNQAIMEFGALQCTPKKPNCIECIFRNTCLAYNQKKVEFLPYKSKKTKVTNRYLNYLVFRDNQNNTLIQKRKENGIWKNLYEFPLIETKDIDTIDNLHQLIIDQSFLNLPIKDLIFQKNVSHKLSHQKLNINFWIAETENKITNGIAMNEIENYPFPIVIANFIKEEFFKF